MNDINEALIRDTIAHPTTVTIERDGEYTMYHSFIDSGESVLAIANEVPPPRDLTLTAYVDPFNRGFLSAARNWLHTEEENDDDDVVYKKVSPLILLGIQTPSSVDALDVAVRNNAHLKGYLARATETEEEEGAVEGAAEDARIEDNERATFREWVVKQAPSTTTVDPYRRLYAPETVYDSILQSLNTLLMGDATTNILYALEVPAVTNIKSLSVKNASWTALRTALQAHNDTGIAYLWDHAGETALSWFAMVPVDRSHALCTALINNEIYVAYPVTEENGEVMFKQRVLAPGKFRLNDYIRYAPPRWVPSPIGYEISAGFPAGGRRRRRRQWWQQQLGGGGTADNNNDEDDLIDYSYDAELATTAFTFPLTEMLIPPMDDAGSEETTTVNSAENNYISKYISHRKKYHKTNGDAGWSFVPYEYKQSESASNMYEYALGDLF